MRLSVFDMFKVGIGPSSSHTVGPMNAARRFADAVAALPVARINVELFGSLGHTGKGHGTDVAVQLGLEGEKPDEDDKDPYEGIAPEELPPDLQYDADSSVSFPTNI